MIHHLSRITHLRAPAVLAALNSLVQGRATSASPGEMKKTLVGVLQQELEKGGRHGPAAGNAGGDDGDEVVETKADGGDREEADEGAPVRGNDVLVS